MGEKGELDMGSREDAETALAHALKMQPRFGISGEHSANLVVAKNVVDEEMGRYGDHQLEYSLQQKTKDTLLAHGRQDVAHALCNSRFWIRMPKSLHNCER
jgi:hypothetical protein